MTRYTKKMSNSVFINNISKYHGIIRISIEFSATFYASVDKQSIVNNI